VAARRDHEHAIVCAAPGANLSVSTTNAEGSATSFARSDHGHAITSSSNPGGAAAILASAADGGLQLLRLGIGVDPDTDNAIKVTDDAWIGLGAAAGRMVFDSTPAVDAVNFLSCAVGIGGVAATAAGDQLRVVAGTTSATANIEDYSTTGIQTALLRLRKSHNDTIDTLTATVNTDVLGAVSFYGVDSTGLWDNGAWIRVIQEGAVGVKVPTCLRIATHSSTLEQAGIALDSKGDLGIGIYTAIAAQCHVDQSSAAGAQPVLLLDQADVDYVVAKVIGTSNAGDADYSLVDAGDFGTPGAIVGWIQIEITDTRAGGITAGDYWMPFYATPT